MTRRSERRAQRAAPEFGYISEVEEHEHRVVHLDDSFFAADTLLEHDAPTGDATGAGRVSPRWLDNVQSMCIGSEVTIAQSQSTHCTSTSVCGPFGVLTNALSPVAGAGDPFVCVPCTGAGSAGDGVEHHDDYARAASPRAPIGWSKQLLSQVRFLQHFFRRSRAVRPYCWRPSGLRRLAVWRPTRRPACSHGLGVERLQTPTSDHRRSHPSRRFVGVGATYTSTY